MDRPGSAISILIPPLISIPLLGDLLGSHPFLQPSHLIIIPNSSSACYLYGFETGLGGADCLGVPSLDNKLGTLGLTAEAL